MGVFDLLTRKTVQPPGYEIIEQIRVEQHEEKEEQLRFSDINVSYIHDPFWRKRFWSIQHVHDVIEGKTFHWFWTPLNYLFQISNIMFMLTPFLVRFDHGSLDYFSFARIALVGAGLWFLIHAYKNFIEWFYWWRFERAKGQHIKVLS